MNPELREERHKIVMSSEKCLSGGPLTRSDFWILFF